ncbi:hypothetical protein A2708_01265 [Candidatus Saccharibacteria bacterium RIFCSPHIGHO2_01_FULL_49_21]|nr:MAG: hypothetical protein A2708_01265 [Candidatus Saccharibacteria bacterium RIFCSPHIGHO2_01_FULL_49_21]
MDEKDLQGRWHSRYEYGDGKIGEHEVNLLPQRNQGILGVSPEVEGESHLVLELEFQLPRKLAGSWRERTSGTGEYRGKVFEGFLMLILNDDFTAAKGQWIGDNRDQTEVNSGTWTLEREVE